MTRSLLQRHVIAKGAALALGLLVASPLATLPADARAGGGFSFGSRGTRSFSAPPTTATAPRSAQPFQQTEAVRPGFGQGFGTQPRRFGFGSGLAAGLLGAGLFGLLTGNGFFGGIGGISSLFGLLFQILLIYGLFRLGMAFFRNRAAGQTAGGGWFGQSGGAAPKFGTVGGGLGRPANPAIQIVPSDFSAFERALVAIQDAYSREDTSSLSRLATPEMVRTFAAELQGNASHGIHNTITGVQLHQGDLAEAWREGATDYASVAMRFGCIDVMTDRASQRIVQGDPNRAVEVTEIWTFRRDRGGPWVLSAIQQTS